MAALGATWQPNAWPGLAVLVLGCGLRPVDDAVNHDRWRIGDWVGWVHDLEDMPWPTPPGAPFDLVVALDVVEHLADVGGALNECWALLKPGGRLVMRVPAADNPVSWRDWTHKHVFTDQSMDLVTLGHPHWEHYGRLYLDGLGRQLHPWCDVTAERTNPDERAPKVGDWQFTMRKAGPA